MVQHVPVSINFFVVKVVGSSRIRVGRLERKRESPPSLVKAYEEHRRLFANKHFVADDVLFLLFRYLGQPHEILIDSKDKRRLQAPMEYKIVSRPDEEERNLPRLDYI